MQQAERSLQDMDQHRNGRWSFCISRLEADLGYLNIPVAELAPEEIINLPLGFTELEVFHQFGSFGYSAVQAAQNPAVFHRALVMR